MPTQLIFELGVLVYDRSLCCLRLRERAKANWRVSMNMVRIHITRGILTLTQSLDRDKQRRGPPPSSTSKPRDKRRWWRERKRHSLLMHDFIVKMISSMKKRTNRLPLLLEGKTQRDVFLNQGRRRRSLDTPRMYQTNANKGEFAEILFNEFRHGR